MRVILNSDVLYRDFAAKGLPDALRRLGSACNEQGHVVVFPITTLLEVERHQEEIAARQRDAVVTARETLTKQGVTVPEFDPSIVVPSIDVRELLRELAATVEFESPTLADFEDAHRRACLHETPHPPEIKSDEMRDLVIWAIALRLSMQDGVGLLVSRDAVHTHGRGDSEAARVNLVRVDSLDSALDYLDVKTEAGEQFEAMISPSWIRLREAGLPVGESPTLLSVKDVEFVQGWAGPSFAGGTIRVRGEDAQLITADVEIDVTAQSMARLSLSNVRVGDKTISDVTVQADYEPSALGDDAERLRALRELLEES